MTSNRAVPVDAGGVYVHARRLVETPDMQDGGKEACGVFGVFAPGEDVARITFYGLYALQHRGQESAGIATSDGLSLHVRTGMGLVAQVFNEDDLGNLPGHIAIGHTRYSTTGSSVICNAQPFHVQGVREQLALGHNGNLVNAELLRDELAADGVTFSSGTDSEVIAQLLIRSPEPDWESRLRAVMPRLQGAYCLVLLTPTSLIAARDPMGNRPLSVGRIGDGWAVASESCALEHLNARDIRDVAPGEVVTIDRAGMRAFQAIESRREALCIFEYIYFARPDSIIRGERVYPMRMAMGRELAREHPVDADVVIGIPDSATAAAIGYAREANLPYMEGLIKNRYVGRTFIQPDQRIREAGVHLKFNPVRELLEGQRVVVVDDTIVRGTTTPRVVQLLRSAGAREVHMRICAPPIRHPCHFGVDMASRTELIAAQKTVPEIQRHIDSDSLGYLSLEGLLRAVSVEENRWCLACFTGKYPIPVQPTLDKLGLERPRELVQLAVAGGRTRG